MSQPALGCLKVCYDVDKLLFLPSLHGYRLAIGYCRVENEGGMAIRVFVISFGSQSVTLFRGITMRSRL
jgi:hypothetical protein